MTNEEKILEELRLIRRETGIGCGTAVWMTFVIILLFGIAMDIAKIIRLLGATR